MESDRPSRGKVGYMRTILDYHCYQYIIIEKLNN